MMLRMTENTVWTDSQDYGADEILYIARTALFNKTNQLIREIIILFEVYPQLFLGEDDLASQRSPCLCLGPGPGGVRVHIDAILSKLGAANRSEAVAIALRKHLLKL